MINTRMLKAAITAAGYTQTSLSKELNISVNTMSSKVNGKTKFNIEEAARICQLLGIKEYKQKAQIFLT